jgi:hypothetical protein
LFVFFLRLFPERKEGRKGEAMATSPWPTHVEHELCLYASVDSPKTVMKNMTTTGRRRCPLKTTDMITGFNVTIARARESTVQLGCTVFLAALFYFTEDLGSTSCSTLLFSRVPST